MLGWLRRLFKGNADSDPSDDVSEAHYQARVAGLERVLGPMENVGHAGIPFFLGGALDMYRFPQPDGGTAFATMELINPDGTGPKRSRIGTYELVAFTRHAVDSSDEGPFGLAERRLCGIMTTVARYSAMARLNPSET